jgi:hypothetical protein
VGVRRLTVRGEDTLATFFHMSLPPPMGFSSNICPSNERRTPATSSLRRRGTRRGPAGFFFLPPSFVAYKTLLPLGPARSATTISSPPTRT